MDHRPRDRPSFLHHILGGNAKHTVDFLTALQNKHRLGMHVFEPPEDDYLYPQTTLKQLDENPAEKIPEALQAKKSFLLSLSLLPSIASGQAMVPYLLHVPGYLFNLSTDAPHPPRIVRVFGSNGETDDDRFKKKLGFPPGKLDDREIQALYRKHSGASWKRAVADDISLSEKQLDVLGKLYEDPVKCKPLQWGDDDKHTVEHNEVLAAVSKEHIAAIFVTAGSLYETDAMRLKLEPLMAELQGALAGYEHAKHGMVLPVVCYHYHPPHQGQFTYIAQGEEECKAKAIKAIRQIQAAKFRPLLQQDLNWNHFHSPLNTLNRHAIRLLHINIAEPLPHRPDLNPLHLFGRGGRE